MESEHLPKIGKLARTARRLDFIVYGPHFRLGIFVFGYCYVGHLCTSSCNSCGVESFRLPWHRSPVSCATTDLVFRYAVKVIVAIIRDHKSVQRRTLVLTEGR